MRKILSNSEGTTLVELLISTVILTAGIAAFMTVQQIYFQFQHQVAIKNAASQMSDLSKRALNSTEGWRQTLAKNPKAFDCLIHQTNCSALAKILTPFKVYDNSSQDPLQNISVPNLSMNFFWQPACPLVGACVDPQVRVVGLLNYTDPPSSRVPLNARMYSFNIVRSPVINTFQSACDSLQGVYDSQSVTCSLPVTGVCPRYMVVAGLNPDHSKVCRPYFTFSCPAGTVLVGVKADKTPDCRLKKCGTQVDGSDGIAPGGDGGDGGCDGSGDGCDGGGSDGSDGE